MESCDVDIQSRALLFSDDLVAVTGWFSSIYFVIIPDYRYQLGSYVSSTEQSDDVSKILTIERLHRLSKREITHLMGQAEIMSLTFS